MKLDAQLYWENITNAYYDNDIQTRNPDKSLSIWGWLEEDYGAKRAISRQNHYDDSIILSTNLLFEDTAAIVIFKLRFS